MSGVYTPLEGQVAIVTGAGSGIGRAIAQKLARQGASIAVTDLNGETAKETMDSLEKTVEGQEHRCYQLNVIDRPQMDEVFAKICEDFGKGRIDILINNAGVSSMGKYPELTEKEWDFNMDVNCKSQFFGMQAIFPYMKDHGGRICNTASMASLKTGTMLAHYAASKHACLGLTKNVAVEYAKYKILVNCVCPGFVKTSMQDRETVWEGELRGMTAQEVFDDYVANTPLGRICMPEDVAKGVAFLVGPESDFLTGVALDISGGAAIL